MKLELGHRAQLRKKPTTEGFTHDWMVFVRGPEQCEIQHFVEKVVFRLHDSFPKPKRGERPRPPRPRPGTSHRMSLVAGLLPTFSPGRSWAHVVRSWRAPLRVPGPERPFPDPAKAPSLPLPLLQLSPCPFIVGKTQGRRGLCLLSPFSLGL